MLGGKKVTRLMSPPYSRQNHFGRMVKHDRKSGLGEFAVGEGAQEAEEERGFSKTAIVGNNGMV